MLTKGCSPGDVMKVVQKSIDTIVVFRGREKPLPYKFRYTDNYGNSRDVRVGQIFIADKQKIAGCQVYIYDCQSNIDGQDRRYQIKYHVEDQRWELYKI